MENIGLAYKIVPRGKFLVIEFVMGDMAFVCNKKGEFLFACRRRSQNWKNENGEVELQYMPNPTGINPSSKHVAFFEELQKPEHL